MKTVTQNIISSNVNQSKVRNLKLAWIWYLHIVFLQRENSANDPSLIVEKTFENHINQTYSLASTDTKISQFTKVGFPWKYKYLTSEEARNRTKHQSSYT